MWKHALLAASLLAFVPACTGGATQSAVPSGAQDRGTSSGAPNVWTMHDATRLRPDSAAHSGEATVALAAARGETVSFQIAVRAPAGGLTGVTLSAQPFARASVERG